MTTTAPPEKPDIAPASPAAAHYVQLRRKKGLDHADAVREIARSHFGNNRNSAPSIERMVAQARSELESPQAEAPVIEPEPEPEAADPDPTAIRVAEAHARENELKAQRRGLALAALTDEQARKRLDALEVDLAAVGRELSWLEDARVEHRELQAAAQAQAEQEDRDAAAKRAQVIQRTRETAARKCDRGLQAFAEGLAELLRADDEQRAEAEAAGLKDRIVHLGASQVDAAVNHAIVAAKLPHGVVSLHMPGSAPLTASISRPVEAAAK